ncbi:MAG: thiamine pyrophosphate-binding protein [Acidimicrobiia bacterium]|nr:thiamine pyrophosphate-binding protein [Acidimicrobiia bacterium]
MTPNPDPHVPEDLNTDEHSVAAWVARSLVNRGVTRVFGLQGGHVQPIWDFLAKAGVEIIDVRHEAAAVHMAHAHAELTGTLGVCLATAGPGVTNCVTGVANAHLARVPVLLIGGCPPRPQANMGPLQDIAHAAIMAPITGYSRTARVPEQALRELDEAIARARGDGGHPGPSYIEFPTDVLRVTVPPELVVDDWLQPVPDRRSLADPALIGAAVDAIRAARRPLVISGRGAKGAAEALVRFLDATGARYLDTQESRGLVPPDHPAVVGAVRAAAMSQADLVITVGRRLDYQLGFGSPAVFGDARFLRIAEVAGELIDNRRGDPEILASVDSTLERISFELSETGGAGELDADWADGLTARHRERLAAGSEREVPTVGDDGRIHPMAVFAAIREVAAPDYIGIADGGDFLSFARIGLDTATYLDAGAFGCLGVGVPFANAAALAHPDRQVICVTGDGAFGINAMEVDTAVRHNARAVFILSNNAAWNIERFDQEINYGGRVVGTELRDSDYAAMAVALGAHGERVTSADQLAGALERALANAPAVIDVVTSRSVISSDATKGLGWVPEYQALAAWDDAEQKRRIVS